MAMIKNQFNPDTNLGKTAVKLSDCQWHCGKHELPGTQPAKLIQTLRQHGYKIENQNRFCEFCQSKTVHRKLASTESDGSQTYRSGLPSGLRSRILSIFKNTEAITGRKMISNELEVDHKFPQVRWSTTETLHKNMSDDEIRRKFQLLTRSNNLWKSRYCEQCQKTDERGTFIGINYFAAGSSKWDAQIPGDDERGCLGCFWYDPEKWRESLNKTLLSSKK